MLKFTLPQWGSDKDLYDQALSGNVKSAKLLIKKLSPQALSLAHRITQDIGIAEDCVQDAFLKLFYKSKFSGKSKLSTFFYQIVSRNCIDYLKKNKDGKWVELENDFYSEEDCDDSMLKIDHQLLDIAISSLSPRQRIAILLWAYDDASSKEVGDILHVDENAANQILHRAKINLKKELNRLGYEK
jgi:RNA polymerase sigma-70 factor (ECF subfamily)